MGLDQKEDRTFPLPIIGTIAQVDSTCLSEEESNHPRLPLCRTLIAFLEMIYSVVILRSGKRPSNIARESFRDVGSFRRTERPAGPPFFTFHSSSRAPFRVAVLYPLCQSLFNL